MDGWIKIDRVHLFVNWRGIPTIQIYEAWGLTRLSPEEKWKPYLAPVLLTCLGVVSNRCHIMWLMFFTTHTVRLTNLEFVSSEVTNHLEILQSKNPLRGFLLCRVLKYAAFSSLFISCLQGWGSLHRYSAILFLHWGWIWKAMVILPVDNSVACQPIRNDSLYFTWMRLMAHFHIPNALTLEECLEWEGRENNTGWQWTNDCG